MIGRMLRAMRLDRSLYDEVEGDEMYDRESWLVVLLITVLTAIIGAIAVGVSGSRYGQSAGLGLGTFFGLLIMALVSFVISAFVTWFVGKLLGGRGSFSEVRRALAYAYSPNIFSAIPCLGVIVIFWYMATIFVATRQAHDMSNGRTALVMLITGGAQLVMTMIVSALGLTGGMLGFLG